MSVETQITELRKDIKDDFKDVRSDIKDLSKDVATLNERTSNMSDTLDDLPDEAEVQNMISIRLSKASPKYNGATKKILLALAALITAIAGYIGGQIF